jgi:transposase
MSVDDDEGDGSGGERRRRSWKKDEKRRIVAESLEDGASVAEVARRHGLNANLLFTWRRQLAAAAPEPEERATILPVTVTFLPLPPVAATPAVASGRMEITLAGGEKIVVGADVEAAALARVVKALTRR